METPGGPVVLVGVVAGFGPDGLTDYKLTERFGAERSADSLQWRCYLTMFGVSMFRYVVFVGGFDKAEGEWVVKEVHPLTFYAYGAMKAEVLREVSDFAAFLRHIDFKKETSNA